MPRRNGSKDKGSKGADRGRPMGHGGGNKREGQDGEIDQHPDATPEADHGRSASSPGHMKKEAGAQSARDFAPGHTAEH